VVCIWRDRRSLLRNPGSAARLDRVAESWPSSRMERPYHRHQFVAVRPEENCGSGEEWGDRDYRCSPVRLEGRAANGSAPAPPMMKRWPAMAAVPTEVVAVAGRNMSPPWGVIPKVVVVRAVRMRPVAGAHRCEAAGEQRQGARRQQQPDGSLRRHNGHRSTSRCSPLRAGRRLPGGGIFRMSGTRAERRSLALRPSRAERRSRRMTRRACAARPYPSWVDGDRVPHLVPGPAARPAAAAGAMSCPAPSGPLGRSARSWVS
jgi:hypothetical protein